MKNFRKIILFFILLFSFSAYHCVGSDENAWKIHFKVQSGADYIGTIQLIANCYAERSACSLPESYIIYFAGSLFTHKDLIGNKYLAKSIERLSNNKYTCLLPQEWEFNAFNEVNIRNDNLKNLITADLVVASYDGAELDAGTVVEHTIAKMLDIPSVILRTDYRNSVGQTTGIGNSWNLMCSYYPRTEVVNINAVQHYKKISCTPSQCNLDNFCKNYCDLIAQDVIVALDKAIEHKPLIGNQVSPKILYRIIIENCGSGLDKKFTDEDIDKIIERKTAKGLIAPTHCIGT